jgi:DNA helicase II / ATP-dependent DNA helicase PcrA
VNSSILEGLNEEQAQAVRYSDGPLLILAGAGSGKTRVITSKIAWLLSEIGAPPESILAVTFTNKAATEMRSRAAKLDGRAERAMIRTFHSFGCWFLRRNAHILDLDGNFTIYDEDDQLVLLQAIYPERTRSSLSPYVSAISRAKDFLVGPDDPEAHDFSFDPEFPSLYGKYEERLRKTGNVDFGDLISLPIKALKTDEAVRARTIQRFRYILVDEYQDSNAAQFELLKLMYPEGGHLCVVGDDDQSIYRFRGAEVKNILTFSDSFPGTRIVRLERNYRSTGPILAAAHAVVSRNAGRLGKELKAIRPGGSVPGLYGFDTQEDEAQWCAKRAKERVKSGGKWADSAILYRTNAQSLVFETVMTRMGIPFRVVGSLKFYEREEIKDALAFLCFLANKRDEVSFRRVINKPTRGIGDSSQAIILDRGLGGFRDLTEAGRAAMPELPKKAAKGLAEFLSLIDSLETDLDLGEKPLYDFVQRVIQETGLVQHHRSQDEIGGTQRAANLEELANAASLYPPGRDGLSAFLEAIALDRSRQDAQAAEDAVTLITMHNTKGLEFPYVIVTGLEQGLFPRANDDEEDIEEQRRLFYVAITRAMDELDVTYCAARRIRGRIEMMEPSMFLFELPEEMRGGLSKRSADEGEEWKQGQGVYHEEYGNGVVFQSKRAPDGLSLVFVRFESGLSLKFIPKYDRKLEKVSL